MKNFQEAFRNGAEGYTPATMWFTHGNVSKKEMTYQIEGFNREGIKDYFIHPSDGTQGDYLGEHFFSMIKHAADEAKRLGINYWIYDEYNWSSGVAGGQVLQDEPWARSTRLIKMTETVAAGETLRYTLPDKTRFNPQVLLCVVDDKEVETKVFGETLVWKNESDEEKTIDMYITKWIAGRNAACRGSEIVAPNGEGYLDTLDKEAVQVFLDKTHEQYKKHIGEGFGDYVKGVFTDETVVLFDMRVEGEGGRPSLPWSRRFLERFEERNGYDIRPRLHELMNNTGTQLNIDYWETVADMFMEAFCQMCYDWCEENNLLFTGHIDAEECIYCAAYRSGDPYEYYKRFHVPGIDTIYTYYRIGDFNYNVTAKLATSAAHFHNKERILSETYTISGWDIRLRDMKRIFNRLALHGINFLQFMGSNYTFSPGADTHAMTNNWQNPLFKHYNGFTKYVSGLQYLVANTAYDAHTLLFYPMTTSRATITPMPVNAYAGDLNFTIINLTNALLNLNIPFEYGFEQVIDQAEVKDGKFIFAGSEYSLVILPGTTHLKEHTFNQLQKFAQGGGKVIAVNGKPEKIFGETVYDAPAIENMIVYDCYEYEMEGEAPTFADTYQRAPMGSFTAALKNAIGEAPASVISITPCDGIMSAVRRKDGNYYVMIISDNKEITKVTGEITSDLPFRCLNTETGEIRDMKIDGKHFEIDLEPIECVVIELAADVEQQTSAVCCCTKGEIAIENVKFSIEGDNTALPDMWVVRGKAAEDIIKAKRAYNPKRVCDLANALTAEDMVACRGKAIGSMPNKAKRDWFGWHPIDGKNPEYGETVVCVYDFTVDTVPENLKFVSDPTYSPVWYLNNEQVYQTGATRLWHYANPVFDISSIAVPGKNRLVAIFTVPEYKYASFDLPCAALKGDFRVFGDFTLTQKPATNELTYWNDQGYAIHTGDGIYTAEFTAPAEGRVVLEMETTDVTEVTVNGNYVTKCLWNPYKVDITDYLTEGTNKLEIRVTSTYSNFIYNRNLSGVKTAKLYVK
ncbi:MAG: hypothetical protein IJC94_06490 [Oscillospiraceae bacterium]|nr:hypothetical protein [Oscillospiraceae bacterium]